MPDFPSELVEAAAKAIVAVVDDKLQWNVTVYGKAWTGEMDDTEFLCGGAAEAVLAAVLPLIEQRVSRDAYPQAWRYGAANARIVAALRAKGTHAADVLADQIEMEAP